MQILLENYPPKLKIAEPVAVAVERVINKVSELYGLDNAEVSVTLTDDAYIRVLNNEYRSKDSATDVLSFAMRDGEEPEISGGPEVELLGDIIISVETAIRQADEYGHSLEREMAFLTTHGMMHLLGYDHMEEADRLEMRQEEEFVLQSLGITR